jgi:transcription initiation factor TFIID subunit 4
MTQTVRVQKVQANAIKAQPMSGTTQIKQIQVQVTNNTSVNLNNNSINTKSNNNNSSSIKSHFTLLPAAVTTVNNSTHMVNSKVITSPINNKVPPHLLTKSISISVSSNSLTNANNATTTNNIINKSPSTFNNKSTHHDKKSQGSASKSKDKKTLASVVAATAASNANNSSFYPSTFGDDDINDVAAMGGVNLAEESQKILGSTEFVGTQIRSCKDEVLLNLPALQQRIRQQMARHGLDEPSTDVAVLISHACQERLKNIVEKLAVISEHRLDILKVI